MSDSFLATMANPAPTICQKTEQRKADENQQVREDRRPDVTGPAGHWLGVGDWGLGTGIRRLQLVIGQQRHSAENSTTIADRSSLGSFSFNSNRTP